MFVASFSLSLLYLSTGILCLGFARHHPCAVGTGFFETAISIYIDIVGVYEGSFWKSVSKERTEELFSFA